MSNSSSFTMTKFTVKISKLHLTEMEVIFFMERLYLKVIKNWTRYMGFLAF